MKGCDDITFKRKLSESCNVLTRLYDLKVKGSFCDVQLQVKGSTMPAHACVLASCSSYFHQLFDLNQEIHWCARTPLVLDLETIWGGSKDLCVLCVSKVVDFMYLKELVISQDHYEHFIEINNLFRIFDPMLLNETFKKKRFEQPFADESKKGQISGVTQFDQENNTSASHLISEQIPIYKSTIADTFSNCSLTKDVCSITKSIKKDSENGSKNDELTLNTEGSCIANNKNIRMIRNQINVPTSSLESSAEFSSRVGNGINESKTCEYVCCNREPHINSPKSKKRKRRKMFCETCNFSSVSISKTIQHLQNNDHIKSICPICLVTNQDVNDIKKHLKYHSDSKPFICHICSKRTRYWEYHKIHFRIHCRNKKFYCELCQRGFLSKRSLIEHSSKHEESHICMNCNYYTTDLNKYQSHLLEHNIIGNDSSQEVNLDTNDPKSTIQKVRKFTCQVCDEKFTQKKNLDRHEKLKHFDAKKLKCSMCSFISDRIDLLSIHLKKKHNCTLIKEKKKIVRKKQLKQNNKSTSMSDFVSVLIPVKLLSDHSVEGRNSPENCENGLDNMSPPKDTVDNCNLFSNTHAILDQNTNAELNVLVDGLNCSMDPKEQRGSFSNSLVNKRLMPESLHIEKEPLQIDESKMSINSGNIISNSIQTTYTNAILKSNASDNHNKETILERNEYIWLNEATGELLNDETLTNMQVQNPFYKQKQRVSGIEKSTLDFSDQFRSSTMNEAAGECSSLDFRDDNDEWQFPQTPQPSVVGIDDCEGLFPWNQINNSVYSTWVLNETTGELNVASFFSIQPVSNTTELKLGENSESPTAIESDDTALFLNEGTGDLSVIYFNPSGPNSNNQCIEKTNQDNIETLSDISDEDSDFLNEEFMRASANFMSNEENNKFLNELTGEFDIGSLNTYQPEVLNCQVLGNESYLNEETGEISWNVMDTNLNDDLFMKPNGFEYDLDDSLNCEDFEPIFNDVNGFSSQFNLEEASNNWQAADETTETLVLNERTGELMKKC